MARSVNFLATKLTSYMVFSAAFILCLIAFSHMTTSIVVGGFEHLTTDFLMDVPKMGGREGGIFSIIISTLLILVISVAFAVPIGLGASILICEYIKKDSKLSKSLYFILDILASTPSVVFGLMGNQFFCVQLGMGFSVLSGGLTLALMVLPLFITGCIEAFKDIEDRLRYSACALGLSKLISIKKLIIPMASKGIFLTIMLSICRALAETAALLYTAGYVTRTPESVMDSGRSISVHIFDLSMNVSGADHNVYASAIVLIAMVVAFNFMIYLLHKTYIKLEGLMP